MSVYTKTRKRKLVEMLNEHGISISYDRVLEISAQLGDATVSKYVEDGVVCPPVLRKGLFTTSAMDNIDHNPTATTATTSFHGTSVSVFQHPTKEDKGEECGQLKFGEKKVKTVPELPDSFTNVRPAFFTKKKPSPPQSGVTHPDTSLLRPQLAMEYEWLEKVTVTDGPVDVTWSAHHASQKRGKPFEVSITSLLPLLQDQAHSVATVKHVMDKIKEIVAFLNPGQVPVIAADQPIYAVAKQVQWHWPEIYGEDKFVIMFGGLHIEMAALKSIGTLLQDSGWTGALVEAGIASPGTADSFLTVSSITRTRQMHQITGCSLYKLLKAAHMDYSKETDEQPEEVPSLKLGVSIANCKVPSFISGMVLSMELVILLLIRSFREANFFLYCQSLAELIPYFFANNNVNYARWLTIHYRDMVTLEQKHPQLAQEFQSGNFVVHKSSRQFSAMAIDQAHEQANAVIEADGGAIGVTEDPSALRRWMIAGPEVSHLVAQYEAACGTKEGTEHTSHHEETERAQRVFFENVEKLSQAMKDMGNPFQEESRDLLSLIGTHLEKGKVRFQEFMKGLEGEEESTFYEPIKKNRVDFFRQRV
ncbi:hypothetical protein AAFF_G00309350 [Aldrovandia affinis]|uniref:Uncharacterized protein n=1 Tax=Aldrovandia affinis TaxID=143900 RepID=A0AAD7WR01_9TELE|nr:hypothetical protein AAFF_G00309350 [Aldrovandia affinis]